MATSKYDYGCHMATGLLPTMVAIWRPRRFEPRSPFGDRVTVCPYRRMATQLNLANTVHSCLVFIDFSFELRSHCHSFRLDRSYCWNFTSNTAKTCFSRIGSISKDNDEDRKKGIFPRRDKLDPREKRESINRPRRSI
ncbi:hypothetical protein YC2023_023947 [Brassica napus]